MNREFWRGRRVFVTGHTGFKGSWLVSWLTRLGASVTGFALAPDAQPNLFESARLSEKITSIYGDVRDHDALQGALTASGAEVVFHLAAQAIVRESYANPVETYATNVVGTAQLLDCARQSQSVRATVVVTSDKCYENREWHWSYRETEPLGGYDPYSSSKACQELVATAYRRSYVMPVATARAGNVIGGGDWAEDRLVPDLMRAFARGEAARVRNPAAIRPWQHVLEPLHGYLLLAERVYEGDAAEAWNFGPLEQDVRSVQWLADALAVRWGGDARWQQDERSHPHEARTLKLDSSRARSLLQWQPRLSLDTALDWIVEWHQHKDARAITVAQIARYDALLA